MSKFIVTPLQIGGNSGSACFVSVGGNGRLTRLQKFEIERRVNNHDKLVELLKYFYKQPVDLERVWASDHIAKQMDAFALLKGLGHEI